MRTPTKQKPETIEVKIETKFDKKDWKSTKAWFDQAEPKLPISVVVGDSIATITISDWLTPQQHADIFYADVEALEETSIANRLSKYIYNPKKIYNNPNGSDGNR
ncbi:MAG: hypothetical protein ACRC2V_17170 [Xenococcaceae cyanobacterium]